MAYNGITYERAAVALVQITRESRYVFIWNAKNLSSM